MIEELTEKVSIAVKKHQPFGFNVRFDVDDGHNIYCLLYTSPSPRDRQKSRMPSSA